MLIGRMKSKNVLSFPVMTNFLTASEKPDGKFSSVDLRPQ